MIARSGSRHTRKSPSRLPWVIACTVVLGFSGCGIPAIRKAEPPPPLPADFDGETSSESSSDLGLAEFYQDPMLIGLFEQALADNRELKIQNEEVQVAAAEILSRSGTYLPFLTAGPLVGLSRASNRTLEGAALRVDEFVPGRLFSNPHGNYLIGTNLTWQLDIYRQLRNARDAAAQRYVAAIENRNSTINRLVAEIAESYFRLMALDKRLENLDQIIAFQEQSLRLAKDRKEFARDTELAVLRFEAEVKRNRSEKLIVAQEIIETENRINFIANRFPQPVPRDSSRFYELSINSISVGVPTQLLQNRPDIREAERRLTAAGLDVSVARANFYPQLILNAGVGLQSFNIAYLFMPQAVLGDIAAGFVGPLVNRRAIKAEYLAGNARQMQAIYDYQRTVLNAFTEVFNRLTEVKNYSRSVEIKKQQLTSLESAVEVANQLFQFARVEYLDVLTAQRDLRDARSDLIESKELQLTATVRAYQALGGGSLLSMLKREELLHPIRFTHKPLTDKDYWTMSQIHYGSGRYYRALRDSLHGIVPYREAQPTAIPLVVRPVDGPSRDEAESGGTPTEAAPNPPPAGGASPFGPGQARIPTTEATAVEAGGAPVSREGPG